MWFTKKCHVLKIFLGNTFIGFKIDTDELAEWHFGVF